MEKRKSGIRKRKQAERRRAAVLCGIVLGCLVLAAGIGYLVLYFQVSKIPENKICSGISIGAVDVSGLTKEEALEKTQRKAEEYKEQKLTFRAEGETAEATLAELGFEITDGEKLIGKALEYGREGSIWSRYWKVRKLKKEKKVFEPVYEISDEAAGAVLKERVSGLLTGASNAAITRTGGAFAVTAEKEGAELDLEASLKGIRTFLNGEWDGKEGAVEVSVKTQKPSVTKAQLETIQDKLGTFSTYCGSGQSRVTNIINGAKLINGTVLMPGEEFSAGKKMQPFSKENGYVEAGAFENGEVVQSMAGGICQVSTTLYNAVINAELEVTGRQPHSMVVNYVKPSRDAAIAGDYKDLKFRNNLDTPVYIEGYVSDGNVVFSIYGKETRAAGRTIEFVSETISTQECPKKYVEDAGAAAGVINVKEGSHKGLTAQLLKVVYENGKEVSREVFNKSSYNPSTTKVLVGTASSSGEYTKQIQAAIKTQDEARIQAAVADVKAKEAAAKEKETADNKENTENSGNAGEQKAEGQ